jgi:hypothetical protein
VVGEQGGAFGAEDAGGEEGADDAIQEGLGDLDGAGVVGVVGGVVETVTRATQERSAAGVPVPGRAQARWCLPDSGRVVPGGVFAAG